MKCYQSLFTTEMANNPSSSAQRPPFKNETVNLENVDEDSSRSFCGICLENIESCEMFKNDTCSHSFCNSCTSRHIEAKIQDKLKQIPCPAINCRAMLNFNACRQIIPDDTLVEWDELLCAALIPESQKLYCPFSNCSALLVNDLEVVISEVKCVACRRSFCAKCLVPWHIKLSCKKFQKLARQGRKNERILRTLAERNLWQKCPRCRMYVEKIEGCMHINCWCGYDFCYECGLPWSESHEWCQPRQPRQPLGIYRRLLRMFMCIHY